jgi:integrase
VFALIGARTEELRALTWPHVDLKGDLDADPPVPPSIHVWRSVRAGGDTKTRKSRRTLAMPTQCVEALKFQHQLQEKQQEVAGTKWQDNDLVFASEVGTARNPNNVLRSFRAIVAKIDLIADDWTPREMRHSFVSALSDSGVPLEDISRLVGHAGTTVTEQVYRKQIRPVLFVGASAMDAIFPSLD